MKLILTSYLALIMPVSPALYSEEYVYVDSDSSNNGSEGVYYFKPKDSFYAVTSKAAFNRNELMSDNGGTFRIESLDKNVAYVRNMPNISLPYSKKLAKWQIGKLLCSKQEKGNLYKVLCLNSISGKAFASTFDINRKLISFDAICYEKMICTYTSTGRAMLRL
jgi:hypothetical protein